MRVGVSRSYGSSRRRSARGDSCLRWSRRGGYIVTLLVIVLGLCGATNLQTNALQRESEEIHSTNTLLLKKLSSIIDKDAVPRHHPSNRAYRLLSRITPSSPVEEVSRLLEAAKAELRPRGMRGRNEMLSLLEVDSEDITPSTSATSESDAMSAMASAMKSVSAESSSDASDQNEVESNQVETSRASALQKSFEQQDISAETYETASSTISCDAEFDACIQQSENFFKLCAEAKRMSGGSRTVRSERRSFFGNLDDLLADMHESDTADATGMDDTGEEEEEEEPVDDGPDSPLEPSDVTKAQEDLMDRAMSNMNDMSR